MKNLIGILDGQEAPHFSAPPGLYDGGRAVPIAGGEVVAHRMWRATYLDLYVFFETMELMRKKKKRKTTANNTLRI